MARPIICVDCESDPFDGTTNIHPFIWGAYSELDGFRYFNSTAEFVEYICVREAIVYAHNGGKFDYHFLLDYLEPFEKVLIISGRLSQFTIGAAEFRDSMNIFPLPLSAYCKDDFDYNLLTPENRVIPENRAKIIKYLESDCVNLFNLVTDFISQYGLNLTIASTALKYWRKISDLKTPKTSAGFFDELTPFYYGGRVECFKKGVIDREFKVIDINSAYPCGMTFNHPYGDTIIGVNLSKLTKEEISRCFITVRGTAKGCFPFRCPNSGKLLFPDDDVVREYQITGWEYLAGIELDKCDVVVLDACTLAGQINFSSYVHEFTELKIEGKKEGDVGKYIFAKLMLNALYGKYASNPRNYSDNMFVPREDIASGMKYKKMKFKAYLGKNVALMEKERTPSEIGTFLNIGVAASITGFVRAFMFRSMCAVDTPLYCDTDSIACYDTGKLDLDPFRLGAWDLEAECESGGIAGKKMYAFKKTDAWYKNEIESVIKKGGKASDVKRYKQACKGARLTPEEILRVCDGETVTYTNIAPTYTIHKAPYILTRDIKMT